MDENKIVGIHQPNFLPWVGYFNKIASSDIFIFLDDVQYPKSGRTWVNRNWILNNGSRKWHTVSVSRNFSEVKNINEIKFTKDIDWRVKYLKDITNCYSKTKHFSEVYDFLKSSISYETEFLSELNIHLIESVLKILDIQSTKIVKSSELNKSGKSNDLLCSLVKAVKAKNYLCGGGAESYMDESVFRVNKINIVYQNYIALNYPQFNCTEFISGLSIIDAMMNCGFKESKNLVLGTYSV